MARDKTARENETESLLDRRSYLKMAGAAAASVAAVSASTGSADAASYDTIEVSAGSTRTFNIGSGETFENKLIDITASGAQFRINCSGNGWAVRNVGVKGRMDTTRKTSHWTMKGNGTVENVYLGDGANPNGGTTGMFVMRDHAGDILIRNVNVQGWPDNGIYASAPGNSSTHSAPGAGGTVRIENSYASNNGFTDFRIGTTGSYVKDSVVYSPNGDNMGCMGYYEHTRYENVDVTHPSTTFRAGAVAWEKGKRAEMTLENCRDTGGSPGGPGTVHGSPGDSPRTEPPSGTPTSPEEAASGATSAPDDSTTQEPTSDDSEPADEAKGTVLELIADEDASNVSYEFTVEGSVAKRTSGSDNVSETNDTITDNDDGTVTVSGVSGNGYGDGFYVNGVVTSMDLDESRWTLRYGGESVTADDLVFSKKLVIDGSNRPRVASTYTFEVSGTAIKSAELGSINSFDTVEKGTISGRTVGGKDGYRFSGQITGFSIDGPANVHVQNDA